MVWSWLRRFETSRPVFVEAESRKVGNLQIPAALIDAMRASACVRLEADMSIRTALLLDEYEHLLHAPEDVERRLHALTARYGKERITAWTQLARSARHADLVETLLAEHYDPSYDRSIGRNFPAVDRAPLHRLTAAQPDAVRALARAILSASSRPAAAVE
jgi:tRNA 2-selenouridine synthase